MARLDQWVTAPAGMVGLPTEQQIRRDERSRLGRELHDSTSQLLVAMQLRMAMLKHRLASPEFCAALSELDGTIRDLHREIRAVTASDDPLDIAPGGLPSALANMAESFGRTTGMTVSLETSGPCAALPRPMNAALYRIAQEALANARRHGRASTVRIRLRSGGKGVSMTVDDNGVGISAAHEIGCGLANMRERVAAFGGRLTVRPLHQGTRVSVSLPR
ncbi:MAG TPA: sensor histidine kinase [Sphingomicrobium sp.]|nr:sensor histidine kinase [Sphingomicrobium sp.]